MDNRLGKQSNLVYRIAGELKFRDTYDIAGTILYDTINAFTDKQFNYLSDLYYKKSIKDVIKFFEDKLPLNKNPRPF